MCNYCDIRKYFLVKIFIRTFSSNPKSINWLIHSKMSIEAISVFDWLWYAVWKRKKTHNCRRGHISKNFWENGFAVVKNISCSRKSFKMIIECIFSMPNGSLFNMISWKRNSLRPQIQKNMQKFTKCFHEIS